MFEDIFCVLCLHEEEIVVVTTHLHTEEEPECTKVLDGKLLAECMDDPLQQRC